MKLKFIYIFLFFGSIVFGQEIPETKKGFITLTTNQRYEFTNLKSITEFRKYTDRKSGKITNVKISTFFSFNNNTLTIKNQNGIIEKYEFFD